MNTSELRDLAKSLDLILDEKVSVDLIIAIVDRINGAAHEIDRLRNELSVAERSIDELNKLLDTV